MSLTQLGLEDGMFGDGGEGLYPLPPAFLAPTAQLLNSRVKRDGQDWLTEVQIQGTDGQEGGGREGKMTETRGEREKGGGEVGRSQKRQRKHM